MKKQLLCYSLLFLTSLYGCTSNSTNPPKENAKDTQSKDETPKSILKTASKKLENAKSFKATKHTFYVNPNEYYDLEEESSDMSYQKDGESYLMSEAVTTKRVCTEARKNNPEEAKVCQLDENGSTTINYNNHGTRSQVQNGHTYAITENNVAGAKIEFYYPYTDFDDNSAYTTNYSMEKNGDEIVITLVLITNENEEQANTITTTIKDGMVIKHTSKNHRKGFTNVDGIWIDRAGSYESTITYSDFNNASVSMP